MIKIRNGMSCSEAGRLGGIASSIIAQRKKEEAIKKYNLNPRRCKLCNTQLDYKHRYNIFCSKSCAAKYNNNNRDVLVYNKQRITLLHTITSKKANKRNRVNNTCKYCGAIKGQCKDEFVCKHYRLYKSLEKFGFNKNVIGTENIIPEFYRVRSIIEDFYKKYSSDNKKLIEVFKYTSGSANFIKFLKSLDIPVKNCHEAAVKSWMDGKLNPTSYNQYKSGWHTTWDNRKVYLRSSYEFKYAEKLDKLHIYYEVESLRIKYYDTDKKCNRCAIPDFIIPSENKIIEIKSNWTISGKIQELKDKFKAYKEYGYIPVLVLEQVEVDLYKLSE